MGWEVLIPLIVQYGLPAAEKLFALWSSGAVPTAADFTELKRLAGIKSLDIVQQEEQKLGVTNTAAELAAS